LNERVASSPASGSTPTAARDQQQVERAGFGQQLARGGPLAGDHVRVVVRRDQHRVAFGLQPSRDLLALLACRVVFDDARPVAFGAPPLGRGRVLRHHHGGASAEQAARQRHGLGVVARGVAQDPAGPLRFAQARDRVVGAAELERPHALEVLALEEQPAAQPLVERARAYDGRAVRHALEARRRGFDVLVGHSHGAFTGFARRLSSTPSTASAMLR
jgi:hypothetical protein